MQRKIPFSFHLFVSLRRDYCFDRSYLFCRIVLREPLDK